MVQFGKRGRHVLGVKDAREENEGNDLKQA